MRLCAWVFFLCKIIIVIIFFIAYFFLSLSLSVDVFIYFTFFSVPAMTAQIIRRRIAHESNKVYVYHDSLIYSVIGDLMCLYFFVIVFSRHIHLIFQAFIQFLTTEGDTHFFLYHFAHSLKH